MFPRSVATGIRSASIRSESSIAGIRRILNSYGMILFEEDRPYD
jgi:hypothetical protein